MCEFDNWWLCIMETNFHCFGFCSLDFFFVKWYVCDRIEWCMYDSLLPFCLISYEWFVGVLVMNSAVLYIWSFAHVCDACKWYNDVNEDAKRSDKDHGASCWDLPQHWNLYFFKFFYSFFFTYVFCIYKVI